jgi:DNA invertase Pin-like site-specific DNA recombinase
MAKAYSYIRFSHPDQRAGDSYRRQLHLAQDYAAKNGLELADSREYAFFDAGKSAFKAKHLDVEGELRRFLNLVESGDIPVGSVLLVESLDRLSRERVSVALPRFLDLLNQGIDVVTLSDGKRYTAGSTDYTDLIVSIVYMAKAHAESDDKSRRVSAAWTEKKKQARATKKPLGRACPAWLKLSDDETKYEPITERVEVIKQIFSLYLSGKGGVAICHLFNDQSVPPFGSKNRNVQGKWSFSSIRKILNNKALIGEYQPTGLMNGARFSVDDVVRNYYPPVIDNQTFARAHLIASERKTYKQTKQSASGFNVWQGVTKCLKCGSPLHLIRKGSGPKGGNYLHCYSAKIKAGCSSRAVRLDRIEATLPEILVKIDSLALVQSSNARLSREMEAIDGELLLTQQRYQATLEIFDESPSKAIGQRVLTLENELEALQARNQELSTTISRDTIKDKAAFFDQLDVVTDEGRHAANVLLKRLGLFVFVNVLEPKCFDLWITNTDKPPVIHPDNAELELSVHFRDGEIRATGWSDATFNAQLEQEGDQGLVAGVDY